MIFIIDGESDGVVEVIGKRELSEIVGGELESRCLCCGENFVCVAYVGLVNQ